MAPYFGMAGGWLTFWVGDEPIGRYDVVTVYGLQVSVACSTEMTLFGYDQGVFGKIWPPLYRKMSL